MMESNLKIWEILLKKQCEQWERWIKDSEPDEKFIITLKQLQNINKKHIKLIKTKKSFFPLKYSREILDLRKMNKK